MANHLKVYIEMQLYELAEYLKIVRYAIFCDSRAEYMKTELKESEKLELKGSISGLKEAVISIAAILNKHKGGDLDRRMRATHAEVLNEKDKYYR
jgi:hypothetical protein